MHIIIVKRDQTSFGWTEHETHSQAFPQLSSLVLKVWCLKIRARRWCYLCKIFDLLDLLPQLNNVPVQAAAELVDVLIPVAHCLVNSTVKPGYLWPKALCEKWTVWVCIVCG